MKNKLKKNKFTAEKNYSAVILAAGKGTRLGHLSTETPKALLPIGNLTIIQHQLSLLRQLGIVDIIIVVGFGGEKIKQHLTTLSTPGLQLTFIRQEKQLGIAHALMQAEHLVSQPFFLLLGDVFFDFISIGQMITTHRHHNATAVVATRNQQVINGSIKKNYAVFVGNKSNIVKKVIEKPSGLVTALEGVGAYVFNPSVFNTLKSTPRTAQRDEYEITTTIQLLLESNVKVIASRCVRYDNNISTLDDLLKTNLLQMHKKGLQNIISRSAHVHPTANMKKTVVGDNCVVGEGSVLTNVVVMNAARVEKKSVIKNSVIS
ncbi:MAG: hypothetical protein COU69_04035, partial [Candidatus Pacebacteria bacterium CG10_big_fil_rev_8_21_14_0_10_56_10]